MATRERNRTTVLIAYGLTAILAAPAALAVTDDPFADLPQVMKITGAMRDFRDHQTAGGHPDFNIIPTQGEGHYVNMVQDLLGADGKPVFKSTGYKVTSEWRDGANSAIICPKPYISAMAGDHSGNCANTEGGADKDTNSFYSWYRDVVGVNMTGVLTIPLNRQPGTNVYVFDDKLDTQFIKLYGFYNPNGLFSNAQGGNKNWSFTYEVQMQFEYHRNQGQKFTFGSDDDLWLFVDGKLVVDIGGVHDQINQTIDMDRLNWLEDGKSYNMNLFFAERHKPSSSLRIETTVGGLRTINIPEVSGLYD